MSSILLVAAVVYALAITSFLRRWLGRQQLDAGITFSPATTAESLSTPYRTASDPGGCPPWCGSHGNTVPWPSYCSERCARDRIDELTRQLMETPTHDMNHRFHACRMPPPYYTWFVVDVERCVAKATSR